MTARLPEAEAWARLRAAGWEPEPGAVYRSGLSPIACRCAGCGEPGAPRVNDATPAAANGGGCRSCRRRLPAAVALERMRAAGYEPLSPDEPPLSGRPWAAVCVSCGALRSPSLDAVRRGRRCPCHRAAAQRLSEAEAAGRLWAAGLSPLGEYPGARRPWAAVCRECGAESSPRLGGIDSGQGCRHCAKAPASPAVVYLIASARLEGCKVGVSRSPASARLRRFAREGWELRACRPLPRRQALEVEAATVRAWRALGYEPLPAEAMPRGYGDGAGDTAPLEALPLGALMVSGALASPAAVLSLAAAALELDTLERSRSRSGAGAAA